MASGVRPGVVDRGRLPVQTRDRRGTLTALALLLVVVGALGSALVVYRSGHRSDELVASREIRPGETISSADFTVARVASDSGLLIPAASEASFYGSLAAIDIPQGTLVNKYMFLSRDIVPANGVIVGITLSSGQRPAQALSTNDVVRVYSIPKTTGTAVPAVGAAPATAAPTASVLVDSARVVEVGASSGDSDTIAVSLLLKASDAQAVVYAEAAGGVAVARLPVGTVPAVDFKPPATPAAAATTSTAPATTTSPAAAPSS